MTLNFMRIVDDSLGISLCKILGWLLLIKHFFNPKNREIDREKVRAILCQKYFGMGSIINAIPMIKGLRKHYPKAKIILLTLESNREVASMCGIADEVRIVRVDSFGAFIKDVFKNIMYLFRQQIDISVDLEFYSKFTMIISVISMAKIRVGLHQKGIRPEGIITHNIYYNHYKHLSTIYFAFATALGIEYRSEYFNSLLPSFKDSQWKLKRKYSLNIDTTPIIIINVNAGALFKYRRWPASSFTKLIQNMIQRYPDYYYVMIGSKDEYGYVESICQMIEHKNDLLINCAGRTNVQELFALIEMSYLMITNDSGPMHIASFYGINIVAFFGPETPIVYGPLNNNVLVFYSQEIYCSPCINVYDSKKSLYGEVCMDNACLTNIKPEKVFEMIENRFFKPNLIQK